MNIRPRIVACVLILSCSAGLAPAQQSSAPTSAKPTAQSDAGEPRANGAPEPIGTTPSQAAPLQAAPLQAAPLQAAPEAAARGSAKAAGARPPAAPGPKAGASDRLSLGTATVTGDREQPKVMYIVPWKSSNIGELSGKPMNSLLDEALAPVDRDEFKREVAYYDAVKADAPQNGAPAAAGKQGEK